MHQILREIQFGRNEESYDALEFPAVAVEGTWDIFEVLGLEIPASGPAETAGILLGAPTPTMIHNKNNEVVA